MHCPGTVTLYPPFPPFYSFFRILASARNAAHGNFLLVWLWLGSCWAVRSSQPVGCLGNTNTPFTSLFDITQLEHVVAEYVVGIII